MLFYYKKKGIFSMILNSNDKPKEKCGVFGIYSKENNYISELIYYGLYALQHRGQEGAGITVNNNSLLNNYKNTGLVSEVFNENILKDLLGNIGIGHVRYSTFGENNLYNTQPLVCNKNKISLAHNGHLVNINSIKNKLLKKGYNFHTSIDSEIILNLYLFFKNCNLDFREALKETFNSIKGSFSIVMIIGDKLIGIRDPYGIKPLCLGEKNGDYILTSESCALNTLEANFIRDINPGEIIIIDNNKINSFTYTEHTKNLCIFEIIYFARRDSIIDGINIYASRKRAGIILAKESPIDADIVMAIPTSGVAAALGYSEESKIPYAEGFVKNEYIGRTFIQPKQKTRKQKINIKLNVIKENIKNKRIILVDDSIVRGNTIKKTIQKLKLNGAKKVHVRISSPPIKHPCYLGINTPKKNELIASNEDIESIRKKIDADTLNYISLNGLIQSTGKDNEFCLGCFNNEYPI
ncbi:MAG: amidophosphoribosyltransferase [Firmicutes bacterium]|nr:amidophosphoribosyltransferase [Bacillota bacterium]